jgi:hypothetical protein
MIEKQGMQKQNKTKVLTTQNDLKTLFYCNVKVLQLAHFISKLKTNGA